MAIPDARAQGAGSMRDRVLDLIGQASHVPADRISRDTALRELGFDSLRHFQLMLEIEGIVGREFLDHEAEAILCCATVSEVCGVVLDVLAGQPLGRSSVQDPTSGSDGS